MGKDIRRSSQDMHNSRVSMDNPWIPMMPWISIDSMIQCISRISMDMDKMTWEGLVGVGDLVMWRRPKMVGQYSAMPCASENFTFVDCTM